jgi:hypothetical protein
MAATSLTRSYDALLSLTADHYYKAGIVHDGVFKSNPTFAELHKKGLRREAVGGSKIQVNLMYGKNSSVDSYSRYGLIDTAPQDGMTPAFYDWAQYAGSVSIDGLSEFQNSGKPAIQKLLREKVKQLTMSFSERMNEDLFDIEGPASAGDGTTGNGGKNIIGLPLYIQGAPTGALDVGGIDQSVETWWANQTANSGTETSGTWTMLNQELRSMYNDCSKGSGGAPNILIADQGTFETYETGMDEKTRYQYTDKASIGFENIKFKGAKMFWDEHVGDPDGGYNWDNASYDGATGAVYFINTKFLELVVGKGKDFAPMGFQQPVNQDARTGLWVFYGQLVCSNRRKQGVLEDITVALPS